MFLAVFLIFEKTQEKRENIYEQMINAIIDFVHRLKTIQNTKDSHRIFIVMLISSRGTFFNAIWHFSMVIS